LKILAKPTEYLLMSGGDLRLNIDEIDLLNKYGCRPFQDPMHSLLPLQLEQVFLILRLIKQIKLEYFRNSKNGLKHDHRVF
jgi:hypothetical protein